MSGSPILLPPLRPTCFTARAAPLVFTGFPDQLAELCHAAGVRLHHRHTDSEGPLNPADVAACVKPGSSVWFCGPAAWGSALAKSLHGKGLPGGAFHREIFEFR